MRVRTARGSGVLDRAGVGLPLRVPGVHRRHRRRDPAAEPGRRLER
ncbi:hypothetical protein G5V59_22510 [Nocardioides sp. W3-2-3]|nr:hypothetical protein [Nocardioides convexus]